MVYAFPKTWELFHGMQIELWKKSVLLSKQKYNSRCLTILYIPVVTLTMLRRGRILKIHLILTQYIQNISLTCAMHSFLYKSLNACVCVTLAVHLNLDQLYFRCSMSCMGQICCVSTAPVFVKQQINALGFFAAGLFIAIGMLVCTMHTY